jgi:subtilase family serine protease
VDISEIVGFVYRNSNIPPCDPCRGGRLPDLAITSTDILSNKDTLEVGEMIWLGVNVHNLGLATAPAPTVAMFRGNPDDGGTLLDVVTAAAIAPGDSLIKFVGQYICETIGEIDLYAIVDWGEEISEMDENNNKASKTIVVE